MNTTIDLNHAAWRPCDVVKWFRKDLGRLPLTLCCPVPFFQLVFLGFGFPFKVNQPDKDAPLFSLASSIMLIVTDSCDRTARLPGLALLTSALAAPKTEGGGDLEHPCPVDHKKNLYS